MRHELHGWHQATGAEVGHMKENGWKESSLEEHAQEVAKKLAKRDNTPQSIDESEGNPALPSGEPPVKRRGRPKGV